MYDKRKFTYIKPDEGPEERNILVLDESENYVGGIDLDRLTKQDKDALSMAVDIIKRLTKHDYRRFLRERMA